MLLVSAIRVQVSTYDCIWIRCILAFYVSCYISSVTEVLRERAHKLPIRFLLLFQYRVLSLGMLYFLCYNVKFYKCKPDDTGRYCSSCHIYLPEAFDVLLSVFSHTVSQLGFITRFESHWLIMEYIHVYWQGLLFWKNQTKIQHFPVKR